jgi:hypothetical protein
MKLSIRGVILGTVGLVLAGLAGCGEDNEKKAAEGFQNTQTAPREILEQKTSKEEMKQHSQQGGTGSAGYGAAQKRKRG